MKNLVFALAAFVGVVSLGATSTESIPVDRISLGVQAGMTFSSVSAPEDVKPSNRTGLAAGVTMNIPVSTMFSLVPEALFVQRGVEYGGQNARVSAKYNSIELPVFAKLRVPGPVSPYLFGGPIAIFNVSRDIEVGSGSSAVSVGFRPRTFDFAVGVGAGVDVGPFFVAARYNVGIVDINENSASWRSRGVHALAGLRF